MLTQYTSFNAAFLVLIVGVPLSSILIAILPDNRKKILMKKLK